MSQPAWTSRQSKPPIRIGRSATWHFSSMPSIPRRRGSETSSATTAGGWKSRARKILTDAHCGLWERSWAGPRITDFEARLDAVRDSPCPQWSSSTVRAPGPIHCSEFRNTSIRILETATPNAYDLHWLNGCSICMSRSSARTGSGLRMWWPTAMPGCRRPCCWRDRLAAMNACFPPDSIR